MKRDPKTDPRKGDVFRKGDQERTVTHVLKSPACMDDIRYKTNKGRAGAAYLDYFRRWAKDAEVVKPQEL